MRKKVYFNHFLLFFYFINVTLVLGLPKIPPDVTTFRNVQQSTTFKPPVVLLTAEEGCLTTCKYVDGTEPTVLRYKENDVFKYKFEGLTSIHLPNSLKGESTKLNFVAIFDLSAESKCSFILRVSSVDIIGPDGKKYNDRSLLGYPARFTWDNGKLDNICIDKRESITASNFKRSIISNLQISSWGNPLTKSSPEMATTYETDIYGKCAVAIETSQEQDGSWIIKKSKDLNQCRNRQGFDFAVGSNSFISDSPLQTNPFVQANLKSVIRIEKGLLKSVEVNEEYNYQPLTNYGDSQTSVSVTTKISLAGKGKNALTVGSDNHRSSSLYYESEKSPNTETSVPTIIKAIQDASNLDDSGVLPATAAKAFSQFVSILQQAKRTDILTTYAQVKSGAGFKNKDIAKSVFWDGLISAGSPATVETAATLLINNEMPADEIPKYLMSLSFVKHPTEDTLLIVSTLLDGANVDIDRYLAVGALVRRYILDHPNNYSPELNAVVNKLTAPILKGAKSKTIEEADMLIASLKGLKNAQYLPTSISEAVRSIVTDNDATMRVKIAALQTLMVNCSDELNQKLAFDILKNKDEDAEMRINAFLVYINNPTAETADVIKDLLDTEESEQVGSYITSYLKNLRSSTKPEKLLLKEYYRDIETNRKFPFDFRQYSRNYEFSQLFSALNLGYSGESDVIFSPQSYVPRTTSFSLSSYLFGNSFNLFQLDTRIENLDYVIEKFIGPRSYIKNTDAEDIADDFVDQVQSFAGQMAQRVSMLSRSKRSAPQRGKNIKYTKKPKTPLSERYIDLDLSLKMFDSEVKWFNLHGDKESLAADNFMEILHKKIEDALQNARSIDVDYKRFSRSPILSNSVIYYPTSTGFPVKLSTDVNSVINFKMNGNVDIPQIIKKPKSADVKLQIIPSVVIQADGMLEIDASIISAGLKASSSVRSATGFEVSFAILDGQGFDLKLGLPVKEEDLFTLSTEAVTTIRERGLPTVEIPLKPAGKRYSYGGTFDQLSQITGLSLLAEVSSPALSYKPTLGPGKLSFRLVKDDETLKYYQLKAYYDNKKDDYRSIELTFDTPGSTINRKISLFADRNSSEKKITAKLISPMKQIYFEGIGVYTDAEIAYHLKLIDDQNEYGADVGTTITKEKLKTIYKPYLRLKTQNDGRSTSLEKIRVNPKPVVQLVNVEGEVIFEKKNNSPKYRKYDFKDLALVSPMGRISINGPIYIDTSVPEFGSDIIVTYGGSKNFVSVKGNFNYSKNTETEKQIVADLAVLPSQWSDYGFKYTMNSRSTPNSVERNIVFIHGPDLNSNQARVTLKQNLNWDRNTENGDITSMNGEIKSSYPLWKFNLEAGFNEQNYNYFEGNSVLMMDKTNLELNGSLGIGNRKIGNVDVRLQSKLNEKSLTISAIRELVDVDKSNLVINLNAKPGKQIVIEADLTHALRPMYYVLRSESTITVTPNIVHKFDAGLKYIPEEKSIHLVVNPYDEKSIELRALYAKSHPSINAKAVAFIKKTIDGTVNFEMENDKVTGDMNINITKTNRLITGKLDLTVTNDINYLGFLEVLWDASKDQSKKLRVNTNTQVADGGLTLNTENKIEFIKNTFQADGNYSITGELRNGTVVGGLEIILSKGTKIGIKLKRGRSVQNALMIYNLLLEGYYFPKNESPTSFVYTFKGRNIDLSKLMFDIATELNLNILKNDNIQFGIAAKNKLQKNVWFVGGKLYVDGTLIKNKTSLSLDTSFSNSVYNYGILSKKSGMAPTSYHLSGSLGDSYNVDIDGKIEKSEWTNTVLMNMPVKNRQFSLKYTAVTEIDVTPAKNIYIKTTNVLIWDEQNFLNWEALFEVQPNFGKLSMVWEANGINSRTLKLDYNYGAEQTDGLLGPYLLIATNLTFDNKQANCLMKLEYSKDLTSRMITVSGESPTSGPFYLQAINELTDNSRSLHNELTFHSNNGKWSATSLIDMYPTKPGINLSYISPEGESKFILQFEEKVKNYWSGRADIDWIHGGQGYVKGDGELKLDSADDILVKVNLDAPALQLSNFTLTATNRGSGDVKRKLKFDTKLYGLPLVSGSISYLYQVDSTKLLFEGEGGVRYQSKTYPVAFKFNRLTLTPENNGETGSKNIFYFNFSQKKYVLDLEATFTDKNFFLKRDLWFGDKCYKLDLSYNIKTTDSISYEENILAHIDLKPFVQGGEEFVIDGRTTRSLSNYNNRMSLSWGTDKSIEYTLYSNAGKAGVIFALPKRIIAAETMYNYKLDSSDGNIRLGGNVWFDKKRNENEKLTISLSNEYNIPNGKYDFIMRSNVLFQMPTLPKVISISNDVQLSPYDVRTVDVKTVLDVFQTTEKAITVIYQVNKQKKDNGYSVSDYLRCTSIGQNLDMEVVRSSLVSLDHIELHGELNYVDYKKEKKMSNFDLELRLTSISGKLYVLNYPLIAGQGKLNFASNYVELQEDWNILNHNYSKTLRVTTDPYLIFVLEWKGEVKQKVLVNTSFAFRQYLNVDAKLLDNGIKNVAQFTLFLDDDRFLQSKSEIFIDNVRIVLENGKKDIQSIIDDGQRTFKSISTDINNQLAFRMKQYRTAAIDLKPTIESANNYIATVRDEIKNDPSIVNATENVKKIVNSIIDSAMIFLQQVSAFLGDWIYGYNVLLNKITEFFEKLLPEINSLYQNTVDEISNWLKTQVEKIHQMVHDVLNYIEYNKNRWREILISVIDTFKDSFKTVYDTYEQLRADISDLIQKIKQYLSSLPITNYLQEKLVQLKNSNLPKHVWAILSEIGQGLKESTSSSELKSLIDAVLSTLDKVLNDKPYDVKTEVRNIGQSLVESIRALIYAVNNSNYVKSLSENEYNWPRLSWSSFRNVPNFWTVTTSLVNWIRDPDFAPVEDVFVTYKIALQKPLTLIPPFKKRGAIIDGQHVITLGGNYHKINGESQYLLAGDFTDYNFTIVGDIQNGKLAGLAIASNLQSIEIFPDKTPTIDRVPQDFPVYGDGIYAIRKPRSIEVRIDNSVYVKCLPNLEVCIFEISGFYQNKVFGMLGTVNSESIADYTLPTSNISRDIQQFIKSYDIGSNPQYSGSPLTSNDSLKTNECSEVFDMNSILSRGVSFVNFQPYRNMCDQAVSQIQNSEDKLAMACKVAMAYSLVSYEYGYYFSLPSICAKCSLNGNLLPYGITSSVSIPQKQADIVIILEEVKDTQVIYDELLLKSIPLIKKSLADNGITDVNFILIGYGPENQYPSIHTTMGQLILNEKTNVTFSSIPPKQPRTHLGRSIKNIKYFLGNYNSKKALQIANDYPYRSEAVKAILQIKGDINDVSIDKYNLYSALVNTIVTWNAFSSKIPIFMVTPLPQIESKVDISSIFGFDFKNAYTADGLQPMINYLELFRLNKAAVILPLTSDGAVFNSSIFVDRTDQRLKLTNVFANSIANSMITFDRTFDCVCKYKYGIYSEPQCSIIQTNLKI